MTDQVTASADALARLAAEVADLGRDVAASGPATAALASSLTTSLTSVVLLGAADAWQAARAVAAAAAAVVSPAWELERLAASVAVAWAGLAAADAVVEEWMTTLAEAAGVAARLYDPARTPEVTSLPAYGVGTPDSLADLLAALASVDGRAEGQIEIQTVSTPDGPVHVVLLPGTDDLATLPFGQDSTVRDLGEDLRLASGGESSYVLGVQAAMDLAGIGADEPVLVVGHSMGGMAAMALAAAGAFTVVGVVTAGAPVGGARPGKVPVVSLENTCDVVPTLDGGPNPATATWTTIRFTGECTSITANHAMSGYATAGLAIDASNPEAAAEALAALSGASAQSSAQDFILHLS